MPELAIAPTVTPAEAYRALRSFVRGADSGMLDRFDTLMAQRAAAPPLPSPPAGCYRLTPDGLRTRFPSWAGLTDEEVMVAPRFLPACDSSLMVQGAKDAIRIAVLAFDPASHGIARLKATNERELEYTMALLQGPKRQVTDRDAKDAPSILAGVMRAMDRTLDALSAPNRRDPRVLMMSLRAAATDELVDMAGRAPDPVAVDETTDDDGRAREPAPR